MPMEGSCSKSAISHMKFEYSVVVIVILTLFQMGYLSLNYGNASDGIAVDSERNVYVTDRHPPSVYKYAGNGSLIAVWTIVQAPEVGFVNASFEEPTDIAIDGQGDLYILDLRLGVQKFNS